MRLQPDLVAVTGDIVEGRVEDLDGFLPVLAVLAGAPLGAWYCFGNHDYFTGEPDRIRDLLRSIGIETLCNDSRVLRGKRGDFVIGGIDDRTLGTPDWERLAVAHGPPHLLLAHHPDDFYEAERRASPSCSPGTRTAGRFAFRPGRRSSAEPLLSRRGTVRARVRDARGDAGSSGSWGSRGAGERIPNASAPHPRHARGLDKVRSQG